MKQRWEFDAPSILRDAQGYRVTSATEDEVIEHGTRYLAAEAILLWRRVVETHLQRIEDDILSPEIGE